MKLSLAIYGPPYTSQASHSAYNFTRAALEQGHEIYRLFFYHDGVYNANRLIQAPQDEDNIQQKWSDLADTHQIDLVVCVASSLRRGVLDKTEADRYDQKHHILANPFIISGLGQLIDASIHSDRTVTFGV